MQSAVIKETWNTVRDRVLNRELECVKEILALNNDETFEDITNHILFELEIKGMEKDASMMEDFELDLQVYLKQNNLSHLPSAEATAIALVWLDIMNTVD